LVDLLKDEYGHRQHPPETTAEARVYFRGRSRGSGSAGISDDEVMSVL